MNPSAGYMSCYVCIKKNEPSAGTISCYMCMYV